MCVCVGLLSCAKFLSWSAKGGGQGGGHITNIIKIVVFWQVFSYFLAIEGYGLTFNPPGGARSG